VEWEGCGGLLIAQFLFADMRRFQRTYVCTRLGRAQNLKTVVADSQSCTRNMYARRKEFLRDRMGGGNSGNHGSLQR